MRSVQLPTLAAGLGQEWPNPPTVQPWIQVFLAGPRRRRWPAGAGRPLDFAASPVQVRTRGRPDGEPARQFSVARTEQPRALKRAALISTATKSIRRAEGP